MAEYTLKNIELKKGYNINSFREDLKALFNEAGVEGKSVLIRTNPHYSLLIGNNPYLCFTRRTVPPQHYTWSRTATTTLRAARPNKNCAGQSLRKGWPSTQLPRVYVD